MLRTVKSKRNTKGGAMKILNCYCPHGTVLVSLERDERNDAVLPYYVKTQKELRGYMSYAAALTVFWGAVELIRNEKPQH